MGYNIEEYVNNKDYHPRSLFLLVRLLLLCLGGVQEAALLTGFPVFLMPMSTRVAVLGE